MINDFLNGFLNEFPPAGEAGAKTYCYNNNNNSRLLGRPNFNITINIMN